MAKRRFLASYAAFLPQSALFYNVITKTSTRTKIPKIFVKSAKRTIPHPSPYSFTRRPHSKLEFTVICEWCGRSFIYNHYLKCHIIRCRGKPITLTNDQLVKPKAKCGSPRKIQNGTDTSAVKEKNKQNLTDSLASIPTTAIGPIAHNQQLYLQIPVQIPVGSTGFYFDPYQNYQPAAPLTSTGQFHNSASQSHQQLRYPPPPLNGMFSTPQQ